MLQAASGPTNERGRKKSLKKSVVKDPVVRSTVISDSPIPDTNNALRVKKSNKTASLLDSSKN